MALHPNDALIKASLTPEQTVAMTIWAEARAEPIEGQIAVGCVIRNRLMLPQRFDDTWKEICFAKWQFSCWIPQGGEKNYQILMARCEAAMREAQPWPAQASWIAQGIIANAIADRANGATHYFASWLKPPPKWSMGVKPVATIGVHLFFKGV